MRRTDFCEQLEGALDGIQGSSLTPMLDDPAAR